jgi:perosamine synthetase
LEGQEGLALQHFAPEVTPVVWAFALRLDPGIYAQGRDEVMRQMRAAGIETRPGFYPPSVQPLYAQVSLPVCEGISREVISLPTHPSVSDDQIAFISETLLGMRR